MKKGDKHDKKDSIRGKTVEKDDKNRLEARRWKARRLKKGDMDDKKNSIRGMDEEG